MNGKEVLENIVINFDNMGMICSNLGYEEFYAKDLHFKEIFKTEYESILKDLDRLEKLEKENQELRNIIKILKDKIELPLENDFDVVNKDDIHLYRLRTKCLINEEEYELLKEIL